MMNNESMANFICELRKTKNLTQKQLAERLNITDKAVSKWERGLGYPDITNLSSLAEMLGVTTNELLSGKREETGNPKAEIIVQNTLQYAQNFAISENTNTRSFVKIVLTASFIVAIIVCVICDLAISQSLTWSLYPISSVVFTWLVVMPLFHFNTNKIAMSLTALSVFVIPFLFCIEQISKTTWLFSLGVPCSIASVAYLWSVFALLKKMKNKLYAIGFSLIIAIPLTLITNFIISILTNEPYFDVWDAMSIGIVIIVSIILFSVGYFRNKKTD